MLAALVVPLAAHAEETALPRPASLPEAGRRAALRGRPLVLLISLPSCPYCERIRRSHLLPLQAELGDGVFQIDLGSTRALVDFDGTTRSHAAVARAWKANFAPSVLFFDARGTELAERLVGAGLPDFYGAYLDQRLETARRALRAQRATE
ncbi:MAG: thioredoxin fold domain-containing protein [Burkholderiaceae bacterium]